MFFWDRHVPAESKLIKKKAAEFIYHNLMAQSIECPRGGAPCMALRNYYISAVPVSTRSRCPQPIKTGIFVNRALWSRRVRPYSVGQDCRDQNVLRPIGSNTGLTVRLWPFPRRFMDLGWMRMRKNAHVLGCLNEKRFTMP